MGGVVVVVQFIRTSISLLVAAFGEPMAHGVPCLLKLVHSKFEMPDCILTARNRHFTDFAFYLHLFVDMMQALCLILSSSVIEGSSCVTVAVLVTLGVYNPLGVAHCPNFA